MIDLHTHSFFSDGVLSPSELIRRAVVKGYKAIAITDHDSIDGSKEALRSGIPPPLEFLSGVEISAAYPPFFPHICNTGNIL